MMIRKRCVWCGWLWDNTRRRQSGVGDSRWWHKMTENKSMVFFHCTDNWERGATSKSKLVKWNGNTAGHDVVAGHKHVQPMCVGNGSSGGRGYCEWGDFKAANGAVRDADGIWIAQCRHRVAAKNIVGSFVGTVRVRVFIG